MGGKKPQEKCLKSNDVSLYGISLLEVEMLEKIHICGIYLTESLRVLFIVTEEKMAV